MEAPQLLLQNNADIVERQFGIRVGEIAVGRPADLAILDYRPPTPLSEANFLGHLIFGLVDATVDTTVCRGKILMKARRSSRMDEEAHRRPFARAGACHVETTCRLSNPKCVHYQQSPECRGLFFYLSNWM